MCKSRGPLFHHPSSSKYVLPLSYCFNNSHFSGKKGRVDCALGKISCEAARGPVFHFWPLLISFCCEEWWKKTKRNSICWIRANGAKDKVDLALWSRELSKKYRVHLYLWTCPQFSSDPHHQEQEPSVVLCDPRDARGIYVICNKWVPPDQLHITLSYSATSQIYRSNLNATLKESEYWIKLNFLYFPI